MTRLSYSDRLLVVQFAIEKYDSEVLLKEKLKDIISATDVERAIDTLIGTQKVRRIGPDVLQNNTSHTGGLPEVPDNLKELVSGL